MVLQERYELQDCKYFNDGSSISNLEIGNGVSCTSNGSYITITTSTNGEKYVYANISLNNNWEVETTNAHLGEVSQATFILSDKRYWGAFNDDNGIVNLNDSSQTVYYGSIVGSKLKVTYIDGTISVYMDGNLLRSKSVSLSNIKFGWYTNQGRVQHIKDIKIKAL